MIGEKDAYGAADCGSNNRAGTAEVVTPAQGRQSMQGETHWTDLPPRPWPENVEPTADELADYLTSLDREHLVWMLGQQRPCLLARRGRNHGHELGCLAGTAPDKACTCGEPEWADVTTADDLAAAIQPPRETR